jgi:hypothetical protein
MTIVDVTNITYDTNGKEVKDLPTELSLQLMDEDLEMWDIRDLIGELIANHTGWLVSGFDYKEVDNVIAFE